MGLKPSRPRNPPSGYVFLCWQVSRLADISGDPAFPNPVLGSVAQWIPSPVTVAGAAAFGVNQTLRIPFSLGV
jgi:hypothetical protein